MANDRRADEIEQERERLASAGGERNGGDDRRDVEEAKERIHAAADETTPRGATLDAAGLVPSSDDVVDEAVKLPSDVASGRVDEADPDRDYNDKNGPA